MRPALTLVLLLGAAAPLQADDARVREFLARWAARMRAAKTLRVRFEQTKTLRVLRRPRKSTGSAWLAGRRLRMELRDQAGQVELELAVGAKEARLLYPRQKLIEVYPLDAARPAPTPFPLFGGDVEALPRTHHITLGADGGRDLLVLVPRDARSPIARVRIWFRDHLVSELEQSSRRGDLVRLVIREFALDPDLSGVSLELVPPPDARIVRPVGR